MITGDDNVFILLDQVLQGVGLAKWVGLLGVAKERREAAKMMLTWLKDEALLPGAVVDFRSEELIKYLLSYRPHEEVDDRFSYLVSLSSPGLGKTDLFRACVPGPPVSADGGESTVRDHAAKVVQRFMKLALERCQTIAAKEDPTPVCFEVPKKRTLKQTTLVFNKKAKLGQAARVIAIPPAPSGIPNPPSVPEIKVGFVPTPPSAGQGSNPDPPVKSRGAWLEDIAKLDRNLNAQPLDTFEERKVACEDFSGGVKEASARLYPGYEADPSEYLSGTSWFVSSCGRVRSPRGEPPWWPGETNKVNSYGYPIFRVTLHKKEYQLLVHCAVAHYFIGPRPPGYDVGHLYNDKLDSRVASLVYQTRSINIYDQHHHSEVDNTPKLYPVEMRRASTDWENATVYAGMNEAIASAFKITRLQALSPVDVVSPELYLNNIQSKGVGGMIRLDGQKVVVVKGGSGYRVNDIVKVTIPSSDSEYVFTVGAVERNLSKYIIKGCCRYLEDRAKGHEYYNEARKTLYDCWKTLQALGVEYRFKPCDVEQVLTKGNDVEDWKSLKGIGNVKDDQAWVSSFGRVKTSNQVPLGLAPRPYYPTPGSDGYCAFRGMRLHRVVFSLFNGNLSQSELVDHIDRVRWNNHRSNLRRATAKENAENTDKDNRAGKGTGYHRCPLIEGKPSSSREWITCLSPLDAAWRLFQRTDRTATTMIGRAIRTGTSYLGYVFRYRSDGPEYANLPGEMWKPITKSYFEHRDWLESLKNTTA